MPKQQLKNLVGLKFGRWTVLQRSENDVRDSPRWVCRCDCGTERIVHAASLKSGRSKSCGCYHKEVSAATFSKTNKKPIAQGTRYGSLTVEFETGGRSKQGSVIYQCKCDCGKSVNVTQRRLRDGLTTTCGCKRRKPRKLGELSNDPMYDRWRRTIRTEADKEWSLRMTIAIFDFFKACVVCGWEDNLCIDHVLPSSKGNGLKPGNVIILCRHCNSKKRDHNLADLPKVIRERIQEAAKNFESYWKSIS